MTRGEAINNRASKGARMVECRERLHRHGSAAKDHSFVIELVNAEIDYAIALGIQYSLEE